MSEPNEPNEQNEPNRRTVEIAVDDSFYRDPYHAYRALRAYGPVQRVMAGPDTALWLVTQYDAIRDGLSDRRLTKDPEAIAAALRRRFPDDGTPDTDANQRFRSYTGLMRSFSYHVREVVGEELRPERVRDLREPFAQIADELLDSLAGSGKRFDLVAEFAMPYAVHGACELIGVPADERAEFTGWLDRMILSPDPEVEQRASINLARRLAALMTQRRVYPTGDMLSTLSSQIRSDSGATEEEIVRGALLLMVIAVETTFSVIGNAFYSLLSNPIQLELLLADESLIPHALEELLRFNGAHNISAIRCATADIQIGDREIKAGDLVAFALLSGNRDESRFPNPDELELTRRTNGHLAFGYGAHHCLGARYARQQAETALRTVLRRYPRLTLDIEPNAVEWLASPFLRSVKRLPIRLMP